MYKHFVADSTQIESHLSNKLAEFLNAEIVLNTINDAELSVMQWIRTTFFYARMCKKMAINQADANSKGIYIYIYKFDSSKYLNFD